MIILIASLIIHILINIYCLKHNWNEFIKNEKDYVYQLFCIILTLVAGWIINTIVYVSFEINYHRKSRKK